MSSSGDVESKRFGNLIFHGDDPRNPFFATAHEPHFNLVPRSFQTHEKSWLSEIMREAAKAYVEHAEAPHPHWISMPNEPRLHLPRPAKKHPIDHFGRVWNIFTQLIEQMDGRWTWCDENGHEQPESHWEKANTLNLCLKFTLPEPE